MATEVRLTPERSAVVAALLFLAAAFVAGLAPGPRGFSYRTFGITEGLGAILLTYIFLERRVWWSAARRLRWVAFVYGTVATAQILELLLPEPGILEWMVLTGLAFAVWAAVGARSRKRLLAGLAVVASLLAMLKFSVVPTLWVRAGPAVGAAWGLGDLAEGARRLVVDHEPITAAGQLLGVVAIGLWAAGTRLLWRQRRRRVKKALR